MTSLLLIRGVDKRRFPLVWRKTPDISKPPRPTAPCRLRERADRIARLSEAAARARREVAA